ncbi:MAG: hypothetical protein QE487_11870 [Fluviicola sp.]|nr:hypothetical protein [Fluviicola sp.]
MIKTSILLLLLSPIAISAQTALIAHKSHSGNAKSFSASFSSSFGRIEPPGNFGEPPARLIAVVKLSDSTVLMQNQDWNGSDFSMDTIYHHPLFSDPNMTVDSLKMMYGRDIEFINFEPKKVVEDEQNNLLPVPPSEYQAPSGQEHLPGLGIPEKEKQKKRHKHRTKGMVWLFVIGGGTFLGFGLLSKRVNKRQKQVPVYA